MLSFIKKLFAPKQADTANANHPEPEWFFEHPNVRCSNGDLLGHRFFTNVKVSDRTLCELATSDDGYFKASRSCRQKDTGRDGVVQAWAKTPAKAREILNSLSDQASARSTDAVCIVECFQCQDQGCWCCDW